MKKGKGMGGVYQPSYKDKKTGEKVTVPTWWIYYNQKGNQIKESSHSTKEQDAWKLLKKRHGEIDQGKPVGPDIARTTFEGMAEMLKNDYIANGRKSMSYVKQATGHLASYFGGDKANEITSDRVTAYVAMRQKEKAANATINGELAALCRMFTLAIRAGKAGARPYIARLAENNARKGFFDAEQFQAVLKQLPAEIRPVAITAYVTGWRVHDEILTRQRKHLDLKNGWLRLEPGETKNKDGRNFPLTPMLREALERQVEKTEALQLAKGEIIPWLFHRDGKVIKTFRRSWKSACKRAGVPGRIPHDFRRTACRNLERAGIDRTSAMSLVGHKTEAIYRRYAIADDDMLKLAATRLQQLHEADERAPQKVVQLGEKK